MPVLLTLGFALPFLLVHLLVRRGSPRPFRVDLRLSRGLAALALVAIGVYALVRWFPLWRHGFLVAHDNSTVAFLFLCAIGGHFTADLAWLGWGKWGLGSRPSRDLVVHHLVGLAACLLAFYFRFGYVAIAIVMTTEMMPVATAAESFATVLRRPALARLADRAGLAALVLWRIPMWSFLFVVVVREIGSGIPDPTERLIYLIAFAAVGAFIALDGFWAGRMLKAARGGGAQ